MRLIFSILLILLGLSLQTCLEPFVFDDTEAPNFLVIDGSFTSQDTSHFVTLNKVSPYGEGPGDPVLFADLKLLDDEGNIGFYTEVFNGLYELSPLQISGIPGRTYTLEITLADGTTYQSKSQKLLERIEADSAYYEFTNSDLRVFIDTSIPTDEEIFLRWSHDEVFSFQTLPCNPFNNTSTCFVQVYPVVDRFITASNRGLEVGRIEKKQVLFDSRIAAKSVEFKDIHFYNVYQRRISEEAFDYWNQIDQVLNQQGTIFDPIPAAIPGNVSNIENSDESVFGYFEVAAVDTVRTFVIGQEVLNEVSGFLNYCPQINSYYNYLFLIYNGLPPPGECCSCGGFRNTIPEPDYF